MTSAVAGPTLAALLASAALGAGAAWAAPQQSPRITVVASFYPLAEWAAAVGGDRVAVRNLTPAGGEPHDFEPTPADLRLLREADLVLTLGAGFQPAVDRALVARSRRPIRFVAARGLDLRQPAAPTDEHGHGPDLAYDPHVWLDPVLARQIVLSVAGALAQADPAGRALYEAGAQAYAAKLDALDARYRRTLDTCAQRALVTSHAAFGYLAARYGLEQAAIRGISPEAEPTPRRLAALVNFVRERGVKYIFTETTVSPKVAETLARETGAKTLVLHTLEALSDQEIAQGKSYLGLMEENLGALATGLECRPL
jgi:zinc transport system substrate-binding protein